MATTSENGSSLADRLMRRSEKASRIGSRKGLFERFGLESPYEGGSVGEASTQAEMFSFLSSRAYFDELRGLSAMRRHLLWRISAVRHRARVGETLRTSIATQAVRAAMLGYDPTLVDWSTQLDLEEAGIPEEEAGSVAAIASRRVSAPSRRQTAAERALRAEIARSTDVLAHLESVACATPSLKKEIGEQAEAVSRLPSQRQPAAARRITRGLRGTAAIAARATRLDHSTQLGDRPLAVAQARDSRDVLGTSKGLRRVLEDSPVVMTLEQPEPVAPEAEPAPALQGATRRPVSRPRAHRDVPVASVAREARTQASTGRAGPPASERPQQRSARPEATSRPTERIARMMRREETAPLTDTRRGLQAALREPSEAASASRSIERRIAARSEAGLPDEAGRISRTTGYVDEARPMGMALSEDGRVTRTMALAGNVPVMSPISAESAESAESSAGSDASEVEAAPVAAPRSGARTPSRRTKTHRTPTSKTEVSVPVRTPASTTARSVAAQGSSRTAGSSLRPLVARSPAHPSRRVVDGALPPMARAVHRSAPVADPASRVAIAQAPVRGASRVDRRAVGLSAQLAAAVARESRESREGAASEAAAVGSFGRGAGEGAPGARGTAGMLARAGSPTGAGVPGDAPTLAARGRDAAGVAGVAGIGVVPEADLRIALPDPASPRDSVEPADESPVRASAQRAVVASRTGSRRDRALPTVRAASRALAQERFGARGRLLSPSSTAHLHVTDAERALSVEPAAVRGSSLLAGSRLAERFEIDAARATATIGSDARILPAALRDSSGRDLSMTTLAGGATEEAGWEPTDAVPAASPRSVPTPARSRRPAHARRAVGSVARAADRNDVVERVGTTGALIAPRAVAPLTHEPSVTRTLARAGAAVGAAADARSVGSRIVAAGTGAVPAAAPSARDARVAPASPRDSRILGAADARLGETTEVRGASPEGELHRSPVARSAEGRALLGASPAELTLAIPEPSADDVAGEVAAPRPGLASRASERAARVQTRRSVVPDATPEAVKAHERRAASVAGASQPVRTESGRVVPSTSLVELTDAQRTQVSPTERSLAWRTPRTFVARTIATRTEGSRTEQSEAVRTVTQRTERSAAFRTQASRASSLVSDTSFLVGGEGFAPEVDPEGAVVRAARRSVGQRASVADSGMAWVDRRDAAVEPKGLSTHALGRTAVRRDAGSLVPHPVGSEQTDRATTRLLVGPDQVYAQAENVVLDGDEAIPGASLAATARLTDRSEPSRLTDRSEPSALADRRSEPSRLADRASGRAPQVVADGMTLAAPGARAESIAGGAHAVSPRPGAPSRSRLHRAMRKAAAITASMRGDETVLTLPSPRRQLEEGEAPRTFQARLRVDDEGRVLGGDIADVMSGASLALPPRVSSAAWAEDRDERSSAAPRAARRPSRAGRDEVGTFVPMARALEVDAAPEAGSPRSPWSALDSTLGSLVSAEAGAAGPELERQPLMRRRTWQRRSMAAELGMIAPSLAEAEFSAVPDVPEDAPSWARRAVKGTSSAHRQATEGTLAGSDARADTRDPSAQGEQKRPEWAPNTLMGALARTESPEDLVQVILDRGRETAALRNELPNEAVRIVETIASLGPEETEILRSGRRVIPANIMGTGMSGTRSSRTQKGAPDLHQLSAGKEGVGANKIMKLADKLMGLIHLAENARGNEAREQVRMAEDSNEARAEGGIKVPGMSVEDMEMNVEALQKNVLNSVMEYFEELDSRREDPDGRNKWW